MPIPLIVGLLMAGGGFVGGALSRQPEINRLQAQVKDLQSEIRRLQGLVKEQDRQIKELKIRYNSLKAYNFVEKAKQKSSIKGALIFQYCFKEYIELILVQTNKGPEAIRDEERVFYNIFDGLMNNREVSIEQKVLLKDYITIKYRREIESQIECNMDNLIVKVEDCNVA